MTVIIYPIITRIADIVRDTMVCGMIYWLYSGGEVAEVLLYVLTWLAWSHGIMLSRIAAY